MVIIFSELITSSEELLDYTLQHKMDGHMTGYATDMDVGKLPSLSLSDWVNEIGILGQCCGITYPSVYVGAPMTFFPCHLEDLAFASANRSIKGAKKQWLVAVICNLGYIVMGTNTLFC